MDNIFFENVKTSYSYLKDMISFVPSVGIVLGSGMSSITLGCKNEIELASIPGYPALSVSGHKGKIYFNNAKSSPLIIAGRSHLYENRSITNVLHPIQLLHELGCKTIVLTNAAGAVNVQFKPGDLMLIDGHINLSFSRKLIGYPSSPTLATQAVYDRDLLRDVQARAVKNGLDVKRGIYCGLLGPSYETAAEIVMLRRFGVDAVGMSTVNEAEYAVSLGMKVLAISFLSNFAAGVTGQPLSHAEVLETSKMIETSLARLLKTIIETVNA
jgi:purine-nucleoside phosphorylase